MDKWLVIGAFCGLVIGVLISWHIESELNTPALLTMSVASVGAVLGGIIASWLINRFEKFE